MRPNPVRTPNSSAVILNVPSCINIGREHLMVSIRLASSSVGYIEQCSVCGWIDEASLEWWVEDAIKKNMNARSKRIAMAAETQPFAFVQQEGEPLTLHEILFQALGAASMCWQHCDRAGVFNSSRAKQIGQALVREVDRALAIVQNAEEVKTDASDGATVSQPTG